jgi:hypothetical protein
MYHRGLQHDINPSAQHGHRVAYDSFGQVCFAVSLAASVALKP